MNKLYIYIGTFIAMTSSLSSYAQSSYTLEQSISYALENSPSIKNAKLDHEISKQKVKETTAIGLPQIDGKVDFVNNAIIQKAFLPATFLNPAAPADEVVGVDFGTAFTADANVTLSQLIFDGSYIVGLQAAKTYTNFAEQGVVKSKTDVIVSVQKAYYQALIAQNRVEQIEDNQKMLEQLLDDTGKMEEAGFAESIDKKRVLVNLNNIKAELQKLNSFVELTLNMLKFQMGMPITETITLADDLNSKVAEMSKENTSSNFDNRIELKLLEVQNDLNQLNLKNEKSKYLPTLGAFAKFGLNNGADKFSEALKLGNYQDYGMIGVSLNVPIWSSGMRKYKIGQEKLKIEKYKNDKSLLMNSFQLEASQAANDLNNNMDILDVRKENVELAKEVYQNAKIKYEEGVGSSFEVTSAQNDLTTAQTNYNSALYDAIIAKIDLDKANGSLNVE